ncbi:MAG: thioesterase family protein [Microthrixaceae bacterium]|nr:thioesterase family protein [Microthrixaceae bacterium]MCO5311394.1 thioesterase family protein [Microthrixaceae bacterium]HPB44589.1 thioesterase family protein [Microthrixaceae bacterium]
MTDALFRHHGGGRYEPTGSARGAWDPGIVHGAAVAALVVGRLGTRSGTISRFTIDFLAPVPFEELTLELDEPIGGRRVQRRRARLLHGDRTVAEALALIVATNDLELPDKALRHHTPFDPDAVPDLCEPNHGAREVIGHDCFDSESVIVQRMRVEGDPRIHQWIGLAGDVVDDEALQPIEVATVAADYAQGAVHRRLPFGDWSYRNAEQTLHFARAPRSNWIGSRCDFVGSNLGAGYNSADLFDEAGRFGQAAGALVIETRG